MVARKANAKLTLQAKKKEEAREVTRLGKALRALGGLGGAALGGYVGQSEGGRSLGTSLGATISRWLGSGAYEVSSNTLLKPGIPAMHSNKQVVRVIHKEYLGPVIGNGSFTVANSYTLNPSNSLTFPWLYRIAKCYQQYTIKGAVFHYIPTSGVAVSGTNPAIGSVMMQTSYRSTDAPPLDKVELLNEYWSSEGPPNEQFVHPIECDPKENPFQIHYVGSPTSDQDRLMYDIGTTHVAVQGMPGTNPVGDLWLTYDIEFRKPVVRSSAVDAFEVARGFTSSGTPAGMFNGMIWDGIPVTSSNNTITFPKGSAGSWWITTVVKSGSNFTACDMGSAPVYVNAEDAGYSRTVLASGSVHAVLRADSMIVADNGVEVTYTLPTITLTPNSSLEVVTRIARYA